MAYSTVAHKKSKRVRTSDSVLPLPDPGPGNKRTTIDVPEEIYARASAQVEKFKPGYGPRITFRQLVLEGLELRLAQLEKQS